MAITNNCYYYVTGPVHVYFRIASQGNVWTAPGGTIYSVGHTIQSPELAFDAKYKPVFSSLSGEAVPDDEVALGQTVKLVLDLARFDLTIINYLLNMPTYGRFAGAAAALLGTESYLSRGRLLLSNGDAFELWLKHSFFNTVNALAYPNLSPGYYFHSCRVAGVYPANLTRDTKKVRLMIEPKALRTGVTGGFSTFSKDAASFVGLPDPG